MTSVDNTDRNARRLGRYVMLSEIGEEDPIYSLLRLIAFFDISVLKMFCHSCFLLICLNIRIVPNLIYRVICRRYESFH